MQSNASAFGWTKYATIHGKRMQLTTANWAKGRIVAHDDELNTRTQARKSYTHTQSHIWFYVLLFNFIYYTHKQLNILR